jgi:hypothetical protein
MSALVDCPHCATRVLPMTGRICPACRKNVDSAPEPEPTPKQLANDAYGVAAAQMLSGVAPAGIERNLADQGLNANDAAAVVGNLQYVATMARRAAGKRNMIYGSIWCVGGIVVTSLTYQAAASSWLGAPSSTEVFNSSAA